MRTNVACNELFDHDGEGAMINLQETTFYYK
jgi:hypothetical protein